MPLGPPRRPRRWSRWFVGTTVGVVACIHVALISPGALLLMLLAVGPLAIPGSVIAAGWCYDRVCANESRATDGTLGRSVATARSAN